MMNSLKKLKITLIGAGSVQFCPPTVVDIVLNKRLNQIPLEICLMDLSEDALNMSSRFAKDLVNKLNRETTIFSTKSLEEALEGSDFVVTAIEIKRNYFWSQDFHIPRKYGFRQIYGENGGPGGIFHTLRNIEPMLHIAKKMEQLCPSAWLLNYTNPEAKLVEAIAKLTNIKVVGLCHGVSMGIEQLAQFLEIPAKDLDVLACGLNHFGWFQKIRHAKTHEDLYPLLRSKEKEASWLSRWDEIALSRILMRTFGLYPYPGSNHIGEYISWSDDFLASSKLQYFYDPATEDPWGAGTTPQFVYSISHGTNPTSVPLYPENQIDEREERFNVDNVSLTPSGEFAIPIVTAIAFDIKTSLPAVNMPNAGIIPGLSNEMVTEYSAYADGTGIHGIKMEALPAALTEIIRLQGTIHELVIESYVEKSKNKLLQAVLLDPTLSTYNNAVSMINEMCELQKELLPDFKW